MSDDVYRNARYPFPDRQDVIDVDFNHPQHGWIPMTINAEEYPELWDMVQQGSISPYEA